MALRDILCHRTNSVAFGGEADIRWLARRVAPVADDPKQTYHRAVVQNLTKFHLVRVTTDDREH